MSDDRIEVPRRPSAGAAFGWLLLGAALFLFSNGGWIVPAAPWLALPLLVRFTRSRSIHAGFVFTWLALTIAGLLHWRGLIPAPGVAFVLIVAAMEFAVALTLLADRVLAPRLGGFRSTLVLPLAWVSVELAITRSSPYGTWGALAYTQADDLPLVQILAVTGIFGVSFLISWFAAVVNWAWERGFEWRRIRAGSLAFIAVLAIVHLAGGARLLRPPDAETVRVASFTVTPEPRPNVGRLLRERRDAAGLERLRAQLRAIEDTLFAWGAREARAGARIVFWSEVNLLVLAADQDALFERAAAFARREGVTLGVAFAAFTPGRGTYENQLALFDPMGRRLARYHKARPVPGDPETGADRHLPVVETPFGRLAGAICFDGDFPALIRESGRGRADLLILPSSDWRAIDPIHSRMAVLRGIENGCPVVRQTNQGLSVASDAQGRIRAWVDYFSTRPCVMVAQVPLRRVRTVYAWLGDGFGLLCVAGLLIAAAVGFPRPGGRRAPTR